MDDKPYNSIVFAIVDNIMISAIISFSKYAWLAILKEHEYRGIMYFFEELNTTGRPYAVENIREDNTYRIEFILSLSLVEFLIEKFQTDEKVELGSLRRWTAVQAIKRTQ